MLPNTKSPDRYPIHISSCGPTYMDVPTIYAPCDPNWVVYICWVTKYICWVSYMLKNIVYWETSVNRDIAVSFTFKADVAYPPRCGESRLIREGRSIPNIELNTRPWCQKLLSWANTSICLCRIKCSHSYRAK